MMRRFSRILEAIHAPDSSNSDWLENMAKAADSTFRKGHGCIAYVYDLRQKPDARVLASAVAGGGAPANAAHELCRAVHAEQTEDQLIRMYNGPTYLASRVGEERLFERVADSWSQILEVGPCVDATLIRGASFTRGCMLAIHSPERERATARTEAAVERLAAHLRVAHELRFQESSPEAPSEGDVVLGSRGEILEFPMRARDAAAVALFRQVARDAEARRRKLRSCAARDSAALWDELLRRGHRVLEHRDSDGRRLILFRMGPDGGASSVGDLSSTEVLILQGLAEGQSNKVIGHHAGLPLSTVATHIKRLTEKLGARSRFELVSMAQARRRVACW